MSGTVKDVKKGADTINVKVVADVPVMLTTLISSEAADELKIRRGDKVQVIIKRHRIDDCQEVSKKILDLLCTNSHTDPVHNITVIQFSPIATCLFLEISRDNAHN